MARSQASATSRRAHWRKCARCGSPGTWCRTSARPARSTPSLPGRHATGGVNRMANPTESLTRFVPPTLEWRDDALYLLDQTRLPLEIAVERQASVEEVWGSIRTLKVRG